MGVWPALAATRSLLTANIVLSAAEVGIERGDDGEK